MAQFFGRIEGAAGLHPVLGSQFDGILILPQYFSTLIARKSTLEKTQLSDVLITDNLF